MLAGYSFRPRAWSLALALAASAPGIPLAHCHTPRPQTNPALAELRRETGLAPAAGVSEQHGGPADGLVREWPRPGAGVEKHAAYALQWYSLAALAVVLAVVLAFRKK